jgi:hypothetical protein
MINESHFLKNSRAIRSALDLDWKVYISQFGMTQKEAAKHLLNPHDFPVSYAMNFCEYYELDIENAFSDQFDVKAFARNYLKEEPILPERYRHERNSKVITLINFVNGLNDSDLGWLNVLIFRRLQIPKTILLYPELSIPFKLILDYLELSEKFQKDQSFMKRCGKAGIQKLNQKFSYTKGIKNLDDNFYDEFFSEKIHTIDNSYKYQLVSQKDNEVLIKCTVTDEFKEIYGINNIMSTSLVLYKEGIAAGLSSLFGLNSSITKTKYFASQKGYDLISIKYPKQHLVH